jgi:hypothetical protein
MIDKFRRNGNSRVSVVYGLMMWRIFSTSYELKDEPFLADKLKRFIECTCGHGMANAAGHSKCPADGDTTCVNVYHYTINVRKAARMGVYFAEGFNGMEYCLCCHDVHSMPVCASFARSLSLTMQLYLS